MIVSLRAAFAVILVLASPMSMANSSLVKLRILQVNDVYDAVPINPTTPGGLARVETLRQKALKEAQQAGDALVFVMAGDFLSPSVYNAAKVDGNPVAGRHMVEISNTMNLDFAVLGNHEFDIDRDDLLARMSEAKFTWLNSNIYDDAGNLFPYTVPFVIRELPNPNGRPIRVGFTGVSVGNTKPWVKVEDPIESMRKVISILRPQVDAIVAITHLYSEADRKLAHDVPGIDLILGGHEHEGVFFKESRSGVTVAKAQSNARTVYDHELLFDSAAPHNKPVISSQSVDVSTSVASDAKVLAQIQRWRNHALDYFVAQGFQPERVIYNTPEPLDGLDVNVRLRSTNLGRILASALGTADPDADIAMVSGGVLRIDDIVPVGPVTEYDVLRMVPRGEKIVSVRIMGSFIEKLIKREPAYTRLSIFHYYGITEENGLYHVNGQPLDHHKSYRVVVTEALYRRLKSEALGSANTVGDIRKLLTGYFEKLECQRVLGEQGK